MGKEDAGQPGVVLASRRSFALLRCHHCCTCTSGGLGRDQQEGVERVGHLRPLHHACGHEGRVGGEPVAPRVRVHRRQDHRPRASSSPAASASAPTTCFSTSRTCRSRSSRRRTTTTRSARACSRRWPTPRRSTSPSCSARTATASCSTTAPAPSTTDRAGPHSRRVPVARDALGALQEVARPGRRRRGLVTSPNYAEPGGKEPRYYQQLAINRIDRGGRQGSGPSCS